MLTSKNPKARPCAVCDRVFVPDRMGQVVCRYVCGLKKARADRLAIEKAEKESIKRRKEAFKTIAQLIADAQVAFNAFIRQRDKDKGCFVCGRPFTDKPGQVQHAGHVRSRGAAGHLRFNEDNCMGECEGCNGPHGAKPHQIKAGAIARIGQERFDALENDNTPHKWQRDELIAIKATYKHKLKEMK
uniref:Putative lambda recombination protein n=1 Tax=viral metagenome TaxID=1070528 RepID=A0A6M3MAJ3_9ZZZZ